MPPSIPEVAHQEIPRYTATAATGVVQKSGSDQEPPPGEGKKLRIWLESRPSWARCSMIADCPPTASQVMKASAMAPIMARQNCTRSVTATPQKPDISEYDRQMAQAMLSEVTLSISNSTSLILAAASSTQHSTIGLVRKA